MDRQESARCTWKGNGECACGCKLEDRKEKEGEEGREVGRGEEEEGVGGVAFSGSGWLASRAGVGGKGTGEAIRASSKGPW